MARYGLDTTHRSTPLNLRIMSKVFTVKLRDHTTHTAPTHAAMPIKHAAPRATGRLPLGILLAGGRGARFDPAGTHNKLLARLTRGPEAGQPVAFVAARRLCAALPRVIAVIRPDGAGTEELARGLRQAGCEVLISADATRGMGASLAAAVRHGRASASGAAEPSSASARGGPPQQHRDASGAGDAGDAGDSGWLVALADMPWLQVATLRAVGAALRAPHSIAAACYQGQRGHPVGFGPAHYEALVRLDGEHGARSLLQGGAVTLIETGDPGVLDDVDTPQAL
jgi:molybdenum cofactor cytidylyltransferase